MAGSGMKQQNVTHLDPDAKRESCKSDESSDAAPTDSVREPNDDHGTFRLQLSQGRIARETQAERKGATKDENSMETETVRFEIRLRPVAGPGCL
jgi:hypothetical protein